MFVLLRVVLSCVSAAGAVDRRARFAFAVWCFVASAPSAHAQMVGSAIRLEVFNPTISVPISVPATAIVSAQSVEFADVSRFERPSGSRVVQTDIDIQASSVTIDFDRVTFSSFGIGTFNGYVLTDVDDVLPDFTGVRIDTAVTTLGLTPARVFVTPNQLFINVQGLRFSPSTFAKLDVQFGTMATAWGLYAHSVVGNLVTLRWHAPTVSALPSGYLLEGGLEAGHTLVSIPTGDMRPMFSFVAPNGAYFVRVRTLVAGQPAGASNEIRLFVNQLVAPSPPAQLLGLVNGNSVALSWRPTFQGGTPSTFVLDVSGSVTASLPLGSDDRFVFTGVPSGTYLLAVRAVNAAGTSAASNPIVLTFPGSCSGVPFAPARFAATNQSGQLRIVWDPPAAGPAPTQFQINVSGAFVGSVPSATRDLLVPVPPGAYTLSVSGVNACGTGAPTALQTVVFP